GLDGDVLTRIGIVQLNVRGLDGELPTIGHGVAGIDGQIHDDLLDLARVGVHAPQPRRRHGDQTNVFADQTLEHLVNVGQDSIEVQHFGLEHLLAAERQELPGERGGPFTGFLDLFDIVPQRIIGFDTAQHQFAVAYDDREHVVEVV